MRSARVTGLHTQEKKQILFAYLAVEPIERNQALGLSQEAPEHESGRWRGRGGVRF